MTKLGDDLFPLTFITSHLFICFRTSDAFSGTRVQLVSVNNPVLKDDKPKVIWEKLLSFSTIDVFGSFFSPSSNAVFDAAQPNAGF